MGIFAKERIRLIREKWKDKVDPFAEELFAILGSDEPFEITGPVTITNNTNSPGLTIRQQGSDGTVPGIQMTRRDQQPPDPSSPLVSIGGVGGVNITNIYIDGSGENWNGDGGNPPTPTPGTGRATGGGGGGVPAIVVSGTGATYTVDSYPDGFSSPAVRVTATVLGIDSTATVPAGVYAMMTTTSDINYLWVPLWL